MLKIKDRKGIKKEAMKINYFNRGFEKKKIYWMGPGRGRKRNEMENLIVGRIEKKGPLLTVKGRGDTRKRKKGEVREERGN